MPKEHPQVPLKQDEAKTKKKEEPVKPKIVISRPQTSSPSSSTLSPSVSVPAKRTPVPSPPSVPSKTVAIPKSPQAKITLEKAKQEAVKPAVPPVEKKKKESVIRGPQTQQPPQTPHKRSAKTEEYIARANIKDPSYEISLTSLIKTKKAPKKSETVPGSSASSRPKSNKPQRKPKTKASNVKQQLDRKPVISRRVIELAAAQGLVSGDASVRRRTVSPDHSLSLL